MEAVKDNADQLTERVKDRAANLKRQARAGQRLGARAHPLSSDYRMTADEVARCWVSGARGPSSFNGFDAPDSVAGVIGDE